MEVETRLFTDAQFVASIQASLSLFRSEFPLVYARVKHLRGEFDQAIEDYARFRFAEKTPLVNDKKHVMPKEVQDGLDVYATYYLALAHLERNNLDLAELMFEKALELLPEPGPNQPYYTMFRRGANANLGRIHESKRDRARAIAHYTRSDPTQQYVGNLLRARELVWRDPMAARSTEAAAAPSAQKLALEQANRRGEPRDEQKRLPFRAEAVDPVNSSRATHDSKARRP